jgi:hypothetical protein
MDTSVLVWDVTGHLEGERLQATTLSPAQLQACWEALAGDDAPAAHRAAWDLVAAAESALPFLRDRVQPVPAVTPQRMAALLADLDSDQFEVRRQAQQALQKLGEVAEPALRKALADSPSADVRRAADQLLARLEGARFNPPPEVLRTLRAVAVLEQIGTAAARQVLRVLAGGAPDARQTREAKASLERLAKQSAASP